MKRPRWAVHGLRTGIALSLPVPLAIALVAASPDLRLGYPLVLLPLLLVGPMAVRGLSPWRALRSAGLAGLASAILATGCLAFGSQVLGTSVWALTSAAS